MNDDQQHAAMSVLCGMYGVDKTTQSAWCSIMASALQQLDPPMRQAIIAPSSNLGDAENLLFGQTCGLPFINKYANTHTPICVGAFAIQGCQNGRYHSAIICRDEHKHRKITDFAATTLAVNQADSNSGCLLLAQYVTQNTAHTTSASNPYFAKAVLSHSHHNSIKSVADGTADITAVDAVTLGLLTQQYPTLMNDMHILDITDSNMGLPFIMPKVLASHKPMILKALQRAITLEPTAATTLCLESFIEANAHQYKEIQANKTRLGRLQQWFAPL